MTSKKILVAEDDFVLQNILLGKLAKEGFKGLAANDGEEALKFYSLFSPDLILLDLLMPKMDGLTVLKKIRKLGGYKLPVIILTNINPNQKIINQITRDLPSKYFVKSSIKLNDLIKEIKRML